MYSVATTCQLFMEMDSIGVAYLLFIVVQIILLVSTHVLNYFVYIDLQCHSQLEKLTFMGILRLVGSYSLHSCASISVSRQSNQFHDDLVHFSTIDNLDLSLTRAGP